MRSSIAVSSATRERLDAVRRRLGHATAEKTLDWLLAGAPLGARALLAPHMHELQAAAATWGMGSVAAFGSRARGDARPDSDLDLVVDPEPGADLLNLARFRDDVQALVGLPVDVVSRRGLRPRMAGRVRAEEVALV